MLTLTRSITERVRRTLRVNGSQHRGASRLPLRVSLAGPTPESGSVWRSSTGYTRDLRVTGLSIVLPSGVIGNRHIFGEGDDTLRVRLELPDGPVDMEARPVRYDAAAKIGDGQGYLVGARILEMSEPDRARYLRFLRGHPRGTV